jgi:hypothetical protein
VDRTGALLGVVVGTDRVAPIAGARDLLDEAVAGLLAEEAQDAGGGFPLAWVGAGAVAVGVAALLFGTGGDDAPTTGGISVTFPGSGP